MRRLSVIAAAGALFASIATGCGDDGDEVASASTEDFCALFEDVATEEGDDDVDLAELDRVIAAAPAELRGDLGVLRDVFQQMDGVDEDDPEAFGQVMSVMFDPEVTGAIERIEAWGVENCGFEPSDDLSGFELDVDQDAAVEDSQELDPVDVGDIEMPDDVDLAREAALIITWGEVDDAFNYRVEIDGSTIARTFGDRYVHVREHLGEDVEVVVEALAMGDDSLGPAPGVEVSAGEVLVVDWTEAPGGFYYVEHASSEGRMAELADAPFVIPVPAGEVERVRFGPGISDGSGTDVPFEHGDEYWIELELP